MSEPYRSQNRYKLRDALSCNAFSILLALEYKCILLAKPKNCLPIESYFIVTIGRLQKFTTIIAYFWKAVAYDRMISLAAGV